jgi:RimJ/RimL family protein N-acetyltransferase
MHSGSLHGSNGRQSAVIAQFKIFGKLINLRTAVPSDILDYERWNTPHLKSWQYDAPWHTHDLGRTIIQRREWLRAGQPTPYTSLEIETKDQVHIGWLVQHLFENSPLMPEIGVNIAEDRFWGRGMGTEACALWIDYLFREGHYHRIGFSTWSGNPRMIAVGRKLGFTEEARIRRGCELGGKFYDRIKMGILREEWNN